MGVPLSVLPVKRFLQGKGFNHEFSTQLKVLCAIGNKSDLKDNNVAKLFFIIVHFWTRG